MEPKPKSQLTSSPDETQELAKTLLPGILNKKVVLLKGQLGSGKTTFVKGLAKALKISEPITSPTYSYQKHYPLPQAQGKIKQLLHFDLYRLPDSTDNPQQNAAEIGLSEALDDPTAIVVIEWPERLLQDSDGLLIEFQNQGDQHLIQLH